MLFPLFSLLLLWSSADAQSGEWTSFPRKDDALVRRHEATFVMTDIGGVLLGGRGVKPVNVYDTEADEWTRKNRTPKQIHHFQAVYYDGLIWIPSAWTSGYPFEENLPEFYVYNPRTDVWGTRTPMNETRRRGGAGVVQRDGKIYVSHGNRGGHGPHATTLGWLDVYDTATDQWTQLPDAPNPRDHTGAALVGNKLCVANGRDGGVRNFFNAVILPTDCFDLTTQTWTAEADIPTGRAGAAVGTDCNGRMLVAGGEGFGRAWDVVEYFAGSSWETGTPLIEGRHGTGLAIGDCDCGYIYIASGSGGQGGGPELYTTERYTPSIQSLQCNPQIIPTEPPKTVVTSEIGLKVVSAGPFGPDGPSGSFVTTGSQICDDDYPSGFSFQCVPIGGRAFTGRLIFFVDGVAKRIERFYPHVLAGDVRGSVNPWTTYPRSTSTESANAEVSCEDISGNVIGTALLTFGCQ